MENDLDLLSQMMSDQENQPAIYRPGPYWERYQKRVAGAIRRHGLDRFRDTASIGKGYADVVVKDPQDTWTDTGSLRNTIRQGVMRMPVISSILNDYRVLIRGHISRGDGYMKQYYRERFGAWMESTGAKMNWPDTLHGGSGEVVQFDGQSYAVLYVDMALRIESLRSRWNLNDASSAMEIGGGYGAFMHLLLTVQPNIRKVVYLDIPPMIYVATQYFRHFFGDRVVDYRQTRNLERIKIDDYPDDAIICICPWQIDRVDGEIDLFFNSASFSEMTPEIVDNYARHVTRMVAPANGDLFLVLNKRAADPRYKIALPEDIIGAFSPEIEFDEFEPKYGHPEMALHLHGAVR